MDHHTKAESQQVPASLSPHEQKTEEKTETCHCDAFTSKMEAPLEPNPCTHGATCDCGFITANSKHKHNSKGDYHWLTRMQSDRKREEETPTARQQLHSTDEPIHHYIKKFDGKLRSTPTHPEKCDLMSANWSREDCLNHIADKVAEGRVGFDIECKYEFVPVQL